MSPTEPTTGSAATILIVEDSPTQALLLKHLLEQNGYYVLTAQSGLEAIDILKNGDKPSLIISDIVMPEMDGYELTRAIKTDEALDDIPVILLTALLDPEDIVRGLEAQVDYYLNKPYDEEYLLSKVRSILSSPGPRGNGQKPQECHVTVNGRDYAVRLSVEQSLNLLVSTYENAVQINGKLLQAQTELRGLNRNLERKVAERTAHLEAEIAERKRAEQRVSERTAQLEVANNELREFAYVVSHDLKAPLRGISQLASWLATDHADSLNDDAKDMIDLILSRLDRMYNLIDGILQYSRIGRVQENISRVDLSELVPQIADLLAPPEHITIDMAPDLPVIPFERTRITQVFQNLLSNAVKFMDKPEGLIRVTCEDVGDYWQFCVQDNGPGISEKYHNKIFQIFQTLSARDEFESTGIGLTLVKKIIEIRKGRIWIESEEGNGARFLFTVPKSESTDTDTDVGRSSGEPLEPDTEISGA
jgi:signal transduction histidine kinase